MKALSILKFSTFLCPISGFIGHSFWRANYQLNTSKYTKMQSVVTIFQTGMPIWNFVKHLHFNYYVSKISLFQQNHAFGFDKVTCDNPVDINTAWNAIAELIFCIPNHRLESCRTTDVGLPEFWPPDLEYWRFSTQHDWPPEPVTLILMSLGLAGLAARFRKKYRQG